MPPSQAVTETIMLHLKEGVDLATVASGPAVQSFVQLTDTVRVQPGFVRQFWVRESNLRSTSMRRLKNFVGSSS